MFSCEMCGEGLAVNQVMTTDLNNSELCDDCVEILRELNQVITASRFVGLK
jgi:ribosome-binding protein aMBF1 (putative translation factor)